MARRKAQEDVAEAPVPEKKKRTRKKKAVEPPPCWATCKYLLTDEPQDLVRICLGSVFVTQIELERMMNFSGEKKQ